MSSSATCPSDAYFGTVEPIVGNITYHTIVTIVSAVCTVLACLISAGLAFSHLRTYTRCHEQRQIIRVVVTPAVISIFTFFGVWFYNISGYVKPIGEYYESFALVAVFFLFLTFVTPLEHRGIHPYHNLPQLQNLIGGAQLSVYYRTWFTVMQILPVRLLLLIITLATSGSECKLIGHNSKVRTAISVISTISTVMAFVGILRMTKYMKPSLGGFQPIKKLLSLKIIVGLDVLQTMIFSILNNAHVIKATTNLNLPDFLIGTPGLMVCVECFLFSILMAWAYSPKPYSVPNHGGMDREQQTSRYEKMGFGAALVDVLNITDVLAGVLYMFSGIRDAGDSKNVERQYVDAGDYRPAH